MDQESYERFRAAIDYEPWNEPAEKSAPQWPWHLLWLIVGLTLGAAIGSTVTEARAQEHRPCGPVKGIHEHLSSKFGEEPIGIGMVDETHVVEVLSSAGGETFTVLVIDAQGNACLIASGETWTPVTPERKKGIPS